MDETAEAILDVMTNHRLVQVRWINKRGDWLVSDGIITEFWPNIGDVQGWNMSISSYGPTRKLHREDGS